MEKLLIYLEINHKNLIAYKKFMGNPVVSDSIGKIFFWNVVCFVNLIFWKQVKIVKIFLLYPKLDVFQENIKKNNIF